MIFFTFLTLAKKTFYTDMLHWLLQDLTIIQQFVREWNILSTLVTTAKLWLKCNKISWEKCNSAKEEFASLLNAGIIHQSNFSWVSPLHLVPKSTTPCKSRACNNYRCFNAIIKPDRYPILTTKFFRKQVFSKLDRFTTRFQLKKISRKLLSFLDLASMNIYICLLDLEIRAVYFWDI